MTLPDLNSVYELLIKIVDIAIVWGLMYYVLRIVRNNSRTKQIFKGIIFVFLANIFARSFGLTTVAYLSQQVVGWGVIVVIIIFQPEIRGILEKIGKSSVFASVNILTGHEKAHLVDEIVNATSLLAKDKVGALISLEQGQSLADYINTGTPMNSLVTTDLLRSLFVTTTPLHDGAVIIKGDRIACASAYFPPTHIDLPPKYGARHRAAIGISEITDSLTIVVSEETGTISVAQEGKLTVMDEASLRDFLLRAMGEGETEVSRSVKTKGTAKKWIPVEKNNIIELNDDEKNLFKQSSEPAEESSDTTAKPSRWSQFMALFSNNRKPEEKPEEEQTKSYSAAKEKEAEVKTEVQEQLNLEPEKKPAPRRKTSVKMESADQEDVDSLIDGLDEPSKPVRKSTKETKSDGSEGDHHE